MSEDTLKPQTKVGQYAIKRVLGRGAFGITYLAGHIKNQSTVAIKEFFPADSAVRSEDGSTVNTSENTGDASLDYQSGLDKFLEESRILSSFDSHHIVRVVDTFELNATAYMVMQYEEGGELSRYLNAHHQPLTEGQLLSIFIPVLKGLKDIHARWLLHRDIKPENIYIRKDGSPLLIDFGTARHALSVKQGGMTEYLTPGFAPPEQYDRLDDHGPWTDIYAVGATMYYCVTRIKPAEGRRRTGKTDPVMPLAQAAPAMYDRELLEIVDWMMVPDLKQRPQSVDEVLSRFDGLHTSNKNTVLSDTPVDPGMTRRAKRNDSVKTQKLSVGKAENNVPSRKSASTAKQPLNQSAKSNFKTWAVVIVLVVAIAVVLMLDRSGWIGDAEIEISDTSMTTDEVQVAAEKAEKEAEKKAREVERIAAEKAKQEAERKAQDEADRVAAAIAKQEAERKAQEEADRVAAEEAKQEAERKAQEEADRVAAEEAKLATELKAKQEADRLAAEQVKVTAKLKAIEEANRISIVPFAMVDVSEGEHQPADIIEADLGISGRFEPIPRSSFLSTPHDLDSVLFKDWRLIKSEALVVGKVIKIGNSQYEVRFRLIDVFREKQLVGQKFVVPANKMRKLAHQISDIIYKKLMGTTGAFDTKIAYVAVEGAGNKKQYLLKVADSDGWGAKTVLESSEPILSPTWSPDGSRLAYVSFEKKRSMIFVQNVWTGQRIRIADFQGLNSTPTWSPDGKSLALTLSRDGNAEIYTVGLESKKFKRLTRHTSIDTEPTWSPDGKHIVFTSDRSGYPQLYRIDSKGVKTERITFTGKYNAGASFSPDGKSLTLITNSGNGYKVGLYTIKDRTIRELTLTHQDESPSFAPNGDVIIYATQRGGRNVIATVSADGQVQQTLKFQGGSVREPAWSPFNRKL